MAWSYAPMLEDLRMAISVARLSDSPMAVNPGQSARVRASLAAVRYTLLLPLALRCASSAMLLLPLRRSLGTVVSADHSQYMHDLALPISNDLAGPDTPANYAVAADDSMLKHDIPAS